MHAGCGLLSWQDGRRSGGAPASRGPRLSALVLLCLVPVALDTAVSAGAGAPKQPGAGFPAKDRLGAAPCAGAGKRANSHELNAIGVQHQQNGEHDKAEACYRAALKKKPEFIVALFNMGTLRLAQGDDRGAISIFEQVVSMQPSYASAYYNMGSAYYRLGSAGQAIDSFKMAVGWDPNYVHAHANLATVLHMQGDLDGAKKHHQESIRIDPGFADGWMNLGNVLKALGQVEAAIQSYTTATTLRPDYSMAFYNLGVAHTSLANHTASVEAYRRAAKHDPTFTNAYYNMGLSLQALGHLEEAASAFGSASVHPGAFALSSYNNLGTVLDQLGRLPEAIQAYHTALKLIEPGNAAEPSVLANLYNSLQAVCDWGGTAELERRLLRLVEAAMGSEGESPAGVEPFHSISYPFPATLALRIARIHARMQTPADASRPFFALASLLPSARDHAPRALRVGYLVDSLSNGTISQYLASLLASHDRSTVKTFVYLLQEARPAAVKLVEALDAQSFAIRHLAPVMSSGSARGAAEAAGNILSSDAIHVLLDLSESGGGARHTVLAFRPAPVQISVGFKSTQGSKYVHYALSDQVMVPPEQCPHWSEKMLYLPESALVKDFDHSLRGVLSLPGARDSSLRAQFGLPSQGVLFCSFGEAYKLDASMLATWTRILQRTPASVLWLPRYNALAEENLRLHLRELGVDESRFVFSPPTLRCLGGRCTRHNGKGSLVLSDSEYLAASLTADIYLDTGPILSSSLAMASLLWAAVPAVTLAGERAVARGSASILMSGAAASSWLVANTAQEYEDLAVALARRPAAVASLHDQLRQQRSGPGVFDTRAWTKKLETALFLSWDTFLATAESHRHLRSSMGS